MKLSVETKVAAAVAAAFTALTVGVIAQGNGDESAGPNRYQPENEAQLLQQAYHASLPAPFRTEDGTAYRFTAEDDSARWFQSDDDRRSTPLATEE
jgi:hypothetical protein